MIGRIIRSANINEITPPKLIPPFHSTAARGTFPIEQTKLSIEITGPIKSIPPANSAARNCQPRSTSRIRPSSNTRLVEANSKAMALVKVAPLLNKALPTDTAAYEQDDDIAPAPAARDKFLTESFPKA